MKERLIELLRQGQKDYSEKVRAETKRILLEKHKYNSKTDNAYSLWETLADYLIANGVIVPPCKVGDTVYKIATQRDNFDDKEYPIVIQVPFTIERLNSIGKTVFLTKEEAEKALKERVRI